MLPGAPFGRSRVVRRATGLAVAATLVSTFAAAQIPIDQDRPRTRLRDRYRTPQNAQKLNDNVRKLQSDDTEQRLEAIRGLGEINEPKAIEYLVAAANDPDMRIRIKAIDTLGQIRAKDATPLLIQQLFMRDTDLGTKRRISPVSARSATSAPPGRSSTSSGATSIPPYAERHLRARRHRRPGGDSRAGRPREERCRSGAQRPCHRGCADPRAARAPVVPPALAERRDRAAGPATPSATPNSAVAAPAGIRGCVRMKPGAAALA
jgi:hypothetical protein